MSLLNCHVASPMLSQGVVREIGVDVQTISGCTSGSLFSVGKPAGLGSNDCFVIGRDFDASWAWYCNEAGWGNLGNSVI